MRCDGEACLACLDERSRRQSRGPVSLDVVLGGRLCCLWAPSPRSSTLTSSQTALLREAPPRCSPLTTAELDAALPLRARGCAAKAATSWRSRCARDPENTQRSAPSARAALARDNACTLYATAAHCCAIHCAAATLSNCHTCRTASSPRWLSHFSGHAAAASTCAATSPPHPCPNLPCWFLYHTFKPSNFGACLPRSPELTRNREAGKSLTPFQHRFSAARTPLAVFQANLPYPDSNRKNRGTHSA